MLKRNPNYTKFDPRTAQVMCLIMLIVIFVGLLIGCKSKYNIVIPESGEYEVGVWAIKEADRLEELENMDWINCSGEMDIMADIKKVDMGAY